MNEEHKCRDCKWLTGRKNIRGIECMNPKNQEKWNKAKTLWMGELRKDSARYKQGSALACKKFEAKESEHMGRYIDADALIEKLPKEYLGSIIHAMINEAPTIEPKRGEWIFKTVFPNDKSEFPMGYLVCSVCGSHHSNSTPCNYCDNCGADMREVRDE